MQDGVVLLLLPARWATVASPLPRCCLACACNRPSSPSNSWSLLRTTSSISPLSWLHQTIPRVESYCFMSPSEVFKWEWRTSEVQYTKCAWWRLCVPFWSYQAKGWRKPMQTETTGRLELCMAAKQPMRRNRTWQFYTRKPQ